MELNEFHLGKALWSTNADPELIRRASTLTMTTLDEASYGPLACVAGEIVRDLEADGLLITWHEDIGEPRHLFADGTCESGGDDSREVSALSASVAKLSNAVCISHWRALAERRSGALITCIQAERGVLTITCLFTHVGPSTRMRAGESAARLLPFVQPFFRIWLSHFGTLARVKALTSVIDSSDVGVILLDRTGELVFVNAFAEQLLSNADGLRRKGPTIVAANMTDTLKLHAAIEQAITSESPEQWQDRHLVSVRRRDARSLMVAVVPSGGDATEGAATVYIVDPHQNLDRMVKPVCEFYRLSPAEARLACILARGHSLTEAAEQLHLSEQTARTYLRHVFFKTDTNRQVELVRLLLLSAIPAQPVPVHMPRDTPIWGW